MKRLFLSGLAILTLSGCEGLFVDPQPLEERFPIQMQLGSVSADERRVLDKVDHAQLTFTRNDGTVRDTIFRVRNRDGVVHARAVLEGPEVSTPFTLDLELRAPLGRGVFGGQYSIRASPGFPLTLDLPVLPIVWSLAAEPFADFTAIGQEVPLGGAVVFATGDTIHRYEPEWMSEDPSIVEVTPQRTAVARAPGSTRLVISYEDKRFTRFVRVVIPNE